MAQKSEKDHIMLELESTDRRRRGSKSGRDLNMTSDVEPLYETDISTNKPTDRRRPPIAGPENDLDDEDNVDDDVPFTPEARPGVDDGFFPANPTNRSKPPKPTETDNNNPNGLDPRRRDDPPPPRFPYAPEFDPDFVMINGVSTQVPDVNVYQHKKTLAQGMMDLALLSANANQLRYVVESYRRHPYYYVSLVFISISLIFQIAVGIGLIMNSRYNVKDQREICKANRINNLTVVGIFIVTIVNVFISAFGVASPPTDMNA